MLTSITFGFALFANLTFAESNHSQQSVFKVGSERFYLLNYQESNSHHIDIFKIDRQGFQDRISRETFEKKELADAKFATLDKQYEQKPRSVRLTNAGSPRAQYRNIKLWPVTQEWSETWEDRYTEWMNVHLTSRFLYDHNISTDCADVAVTYRWIFAFLNGLPAGNQLAGSGRLFTQDSAPASWESLPTHENWWENQRFLRALEYLHDNTYTGSVFYDLYPVQITPRAVSAGAVWIINRYHTYNVGQLNFQDPTWLKWYSSTVPRKVRKLYEAQFSAKQPVFDDAGFQRPRWIKKENNRWVMTAAAQMPWYSLEQYEPSFATIPELFDEAVYERLSGMPLPAEHKFRGYSNALYSQSYNRVEVVQDGFNACNPDRCPEGSQAYEDHSTPSRDARILDLILKIENLLNEQNDEMLNDEWSYMLRNYAVRVYSQESSHDVYLQDIVRIWKNQSYSSDPNVDILTRWGLVPENPDMQSEEEIQAANEAIQSLFPSINSGEFMSMQSRTDLLSKYSHIDPTKVIPENLKNEALTFFELNKSGFANKTHISIVDFSRHSSRARYYLVNMTTGAVTRFYTAHGAGSDTNNDGVAERFSNTVDSHMSSLGAMRTGEVYSGNFGRSMRLDGLVSSNSNVRRRAIVVHGSDYVHQRAVKQGRSFGCLALDWDIKDDLITKINGGSLIYVGQSGTSRN